jgi:hypothetical protein
VRFLRERFARAIERGDDATAQRLSILLDQALNAPQAASSDGA